jgi:hypothetical protein
MAMMHKYQKRISCPILDRIDIHLDTLRVAVQKLASLDGVKLQPASGGSLRRRALSDLSFKLCTEKSETIVHNASASFRNTY